MAVRAVMSGAVCGVAVLLGGFFLAARMLPAPPAMPQETAGGTVAPLIPKAQPAKLAEPAPAAPPTEPGTGPSDAVSAAAKQVPVIAVLPVAKGSTEASAAPSAQPLPEPVTPAGTEAATPGAKAVTLNPDQNPAPVAPADATQPVIVADTPVPALLVPPATGGGGAAESDPVLPDPAAVITQTGQDAPALVALSQTTEPEPPETVANLIAPLPQPDALPGPGAADQPGQVQAALPVPGTDAAAQPAAGKIVATLAEPVLPQSLAAPQTETVAKTAAKPEAAPGPQGAAVPALTAAGEDEAPMAVANPAPAAVSRADIILADPAAAKAAEASPGLTDPGIVPLADQGVLVDAAPPAKPKILEHGTAKPVLPGAATGPATGFAGTTPGVTLNRLPRIGGETPTNPAAEPALDPSGLPPLERNSADFENPQGRPLFSVILLDTGEMDPAALLNIGFPVTIALDPMRADVAQAAMAWRAAGQEVLILATALPAGATAADVEVTFQSHFASLPSALGVIDLPQKGFQDDRALSQNIVETLKGAGYGLVTFDRGLDPAAQVAKREGVRQAMVFRTLDAEGENVPTVRRYLDRAAFKAAQLGSVVVFGSTRPDTVQGLIEWAAEGRAATVVMAPISAVMSLE